MGCSHNCDSCSSHCGGEKSLKVAANPAASVKKVIGVVSGKGGVGKSLLTSMMAVGMTRKGYSCGVLDADITGPSIPKTFGVHGQLEGCEEGILPARSEGGVQMISINLVLPHEDDPVIYRGPIIAETVKQFWSDVVWDDVGLPVCRYASRNGRRTADRVPVLAGGRYHRCHLAAGSGLHDRRQGG